MNVDLDESGGFIDWVTPEPIEHGAPVDDAPYDCPECGVEDAEYSQHEADCPSGFPTVTDTEVFDSNWHPVLGPGPR